MPPQPRSSVLQRARMRDPEDHETDQRCRAHRYDAVGQHAEPGRKLAHLLPPLVIDGERAQPARRHEQHDSRDQVKQTAAAAWAASDLSMTKGGVQVSSNSIIRTGAWHGHPAA